MSACKICGSPTRPFGKVDSNRSCEDAKGAVLPPSGVEIPYVRCTSCGLIFTSAFDDWSHEDFKARIYNEGYAAVDPEYATKRPAANAGVIVANWAEYKDSIRFLDYGGGNGHLAMVLRRHGFDARSYDPFTPEYAERPDSKFEFISCYETLEHVPDPKGVAADIASLLAEDGCVLFTTLVQPDNIEQVGVRWWYIGPRNGHITLHTKQSLALSWAAVGLGLVSFSNVVHAALKPGSPYLAPVANRAR